MQTRSSLRRTGLLEFLFVGSAYAQKYVLATLTKRLCIVIIYDAMPNFSPQPNESEYNLDPSLLRDAFSQADRLLEGVFSETEDMTSEIDDTSFVAAGREVYFPLNPIGIEGNVRIIQVQIANVDHIETDILVEKKNDELSIEGYKVFETQILHFGSDLDGEIADDMYKIERRVYKNGKLVSPGKSKDFALPPNPDRDNPDHIELIKRQLDQHAFEALALSRFQPKLDNDKLSSIIELLKKLEVKNRTVVEGTENISDIDLRG